MTAQIQEFFQRYLGRDDFSFISGKIGATFMYDLARSLLSISILLLAGLLFVTLDSSNKILANGPHLQSQQVFAGPVGNYELQVLATKNIGTVHLSIYVSNLTGEVSVQDLDIIVSGQGPSGSSLRFNNQRPTASFSSPGWFGLDVDTFEEFGEWDFVINIEGPIETGVAKFSLNIERTNGFNLFTWGAIAVFLSTLIAFTTLSMKRRKAKFK